MDTDAWETVELRVEAGVATVALNRPEVRNAFNAAMIRELTEVFQALGARVDVRAIVLKGNGPLFSAGADINWMRQSLDFSTEDNIADARRMSDMFAAIDAVPQAVVGCVHGAALGGGMGLIACCDIVVADSQSMFGFTETKLGIIPSVISRFVLPKIGTSWARALFLTGERFPAEVARSIGLVHWIVTRDELDMVVEAKVTELRSSGPAAVREAKCLISEVAAMPESDVRDHSARRIAELRASPEGQEGLRAFLEKRRPGWRS